MWENRAGEREAGGGARVNGIQTEGPGQRGGDQNTVILASAEGLSLWTIPLLRERCSLTLTLRSGGGVAHLQAASPPSFSTSASYGNGRRNAASVECDRGWPLPICCHICTLPGLWWAEGARACVLGAACFPQGRCSTPPTQGTKQQVIPESRVLPWILCLISPLPKQCSAKIPVSNQDGAGISSQSLGQWAAQVQKNKAFLSSFACVTCYK